MKLLDIVQRVAIPVPWSEGEKIPWNEPGFSQRMLKEHLSQEHDSASRRLEKIEQQVTWIHRHILSERQSNILDLGCGPGLYANRLALLGHTCMGIDFAPAAITYARDTAAEQDLPCTYIQADIREVHYGTGYDFAMFIYGELNVFQCADALKILCKVCDSLKTGGLLLLEPHTFAAVQRLGQSPPLWYSSAGDVFLDKAHLCLLENLWNAERAVAIQRYFIIDALSSEVSRYSASVQAYTDEQYHELLVAAGFREINMYPSLTGQLNQSQRDLFVIVARK
ncbi:MAG: methyltransferase domain-containing protein [Anaerolineae bacterium]|nr:methyltransferase domain-containing protein [Anaerolineae bacterium]